MIPPDKVNVLELPDIILRFKNSYPTSLTSITLSATASLLSIVKVIGESSSLPEQANTSGINSNSRNVSNYSIVIVPTIPECAEHW